MPLPAAPRPICPTVLWRRLTSERRVALMRAASVTTAVPCWRSEEHTSELQSQSNLVCRLLLEKKKPDLYFHGWHVWQGVHRLETEEEDLALHARLNHHTVSLLCDRGDSAIHQASCGHVVGPRV